MPRYQIRIPKYEEFENVLDSIVQSAWTAILPHLDPRALQPEDLEDFRSAVKAGLSPYFHAYDLCGTAVECTDEIEGAPLLDRDDSIFFLIVPEGFSELVSELAFAGYYSVKRLARQKEVDFLLATLEAAFRHDLNQYIFYNPVCGKIDLCNHSREINPFSRH